MLYFSVYQNTFPHNYGYIWGYVGGDTEQSESIMFKLFDILPHGSGINDRWSVTQHKSNSNRFTCHNAYDAMNEWGMYCHVYPFSVTFDYNPTTDKFMFVRFSFKGNREYVCCGWSVADYLQDTMHYALEFRQNKE